MNKHLGMYHAIRTLRQQGLTYTEINEKLGVKIPKSTLSYICRRIELNDEQISRIAKLTKESLIWKRQKAIQVNKKNLDEKIQGYRTRNIAIKQFMENRNAKLVALSMLYLGEGAKWKSNRSLKLGSASPVIIKLYIRLLDECYGIDKDKLKARVQQRADQDSLELVKYWSSITGIQKTNFYPSYIDKRTLGKPTLKKDYRGVCTVSCAGTHIQLELEQIIDIISDAVTGSSYNG